MTARNEGFENNQTLANIKDWFVQDVKYEIYNFRGAREFSSI